MSDKTHGLNVEQRRRYMRFPPDPLDTAQIDTAGGRTFTPSHVALITQEGYGGCGTLLAYYEGIEDLFTIGKHCQIKAGKLDPMSATVAWARNLEDEVYKVGFKFVDEE